MVEESLYENKDDDMFNDIKNGTGWATYDYVLNAKHSPLSKKERVRLLIKLAKAGILADEDKMSGKEQHLKQISRNALMSVQDLERKYKSRTNPSVNEGQYAGDVLQHKHNSNISIELVSTTNRGWKVKETTKKGNRSKTKTAFYDDQDIRGDKAIYESRSWESYSWFRDERKKVMVGKGARHEYRGKGDYLSFGYDKKTKFFSLIRDRDKYVLYSDKDFGKVYDKMGEVTDKFHNESINESNISKSMLKKVGGKEMAFYDELESLQDKIGNPKYMVWLSKELKSLGVNIQSDSRIKNKAEAEETLYNLSK